MNLTNDDLEIDQRVVKINVLCNENRWQCVLISSRHGEFSDEKTSQLYLGLSLTNKTTRRFMLETKTKSAPLNLPR